MDTEDRLTALEARLEKLSPAVRSNTSRIRSLRACLILPVFLATIAFLQVEKIEWSGERISLSFRDATWEALGFGAFAAGLVMDGDVKKMLGVLASIVRK